MLNPVSDLDIAGFENDSQPTISSIIAPPSQNFQPPVATGLEALRDSTKLVIATDSEWEGDQHIVTSASIAGLKFLFWTSAAMSVMGRKDLDRYTRKFGGIPVFDFVSPHSYVMNNLSELKSYELMMFYSPRDLRYWFGEGLFRETVTHGFLKQKRRITASGMNFDRSLLLGNTQCYKNKREAKDDRFIRVTIDDLKGNAPGSLASLAGITGVKIDKDIIDPATDLPVPKSEMLTALKVNPERFIEYALNDAALLPEMRMKFNQRVSDLMLEATGVHIKPANIKGTNGAMVAQYLHRFLLSRGDNVETALKRVGVISQSLPVDDVTEAAEIERNLIALIKNDGWEAVSSGLEGLQLIKQYNRVARDSTGLNGASSAILGLNRDTSAYAALVQGGRANNEKPFQNRFERGIDIDLSSCYGTKLRDFDYPLGLPTVIGYKPSEERLTLGKMLKKLKGQLVPGLWQMTVNGYLPFAQDLIYSKRTTISKINRAVGAMEFEDDGEQTERRDANDVSKLPGEFALVRKQIINGVIEAKTLEVLEKVATASELKQLMNLTVESVVYYAKDDRVDTVEAWVATVMGSEGIYRVKGDDRSRAWVTVPMADFVGPLLANRKKFKLERDQYPKGSQEWMDGNAKQEMMKLFVNTIYGVLASPFFEVGNAVLANNITAAARVGVWQMGKALGLAQSITDGGLFELEKVRFYSQKKPGLAVLTDTFNYADVRNCRTESSLGGLDWRGKDWERLLTGEGINQWLDPICLKHINDFWLPYELSFDFAVEIKADHTFNRAITLNKTDYLFEPIPILRANKKAETYCSDGVCLDVTGLILKVRGERFDFENPETVAGKIQFMLSLLYPEQTKEWALKFKHTQSKIQTITAYSRGHFEGVLPGDDVINSRHLKLGYKAFSVSDWKEYDRRAKQSLDLEGLETVAPDTILRTIRSKIKG